VELRWVKAATLKLAAAWLGYWALSAGELEAVFAVL